MWLRVLQICTLSLVFPLSAWATTDDTRLIRRWETQLSQGDNEALLETVKGISPKSKHAVWALSEGVRLHYLKERWAPFFGLSTYFRTRYPNRVETENVRLLEILALLRHCQWNSARRILEEGKGGKTTQWQEASSHIAELLELVPRLSHEIPPEDSGSKRDGIFSSRKLWPIRTQNVSGLDPHKLRRHVEAKCDK